MQAQKTSFNIYTHSLTGRPDGASRLDTIGSASYDGVRRALLYVGAHHIQMLNSKSLERKESRAWLSFRFGRSASGARLFPMTLGRDAAVKR